MLKRGASQRWNGLCRSILGGALLVLAASVTADAQVRDLTVRCIEIDSDGTIGGEAPFICSGLTAPEGSLVGKPGDIFIETDGAAGLVIWTKDGGTGDDDSGWVILGSVGAPAALVADTLTLDVANADTRISRLAAGSFRFAEVGGGAENFKIDLSGTNVSLFESQSGASNYVWTAAGQVDFDIRGPVGTNGILNLTRADASIASGAFLGRANFVATEESDGSDATLPGASIWAEAKATFNATTNTTDLHFGTATSEDAGVTPDMTLTSAGFLGVSTTDPSHSIEAVVDGGPSFITATSYDSAVQFLGRATGGTQASPTATPTDRILGGMSGRGFANSVFTSTTSQIAFKSSELFSASAEGTRIVFEVTPLGSTTRSQAMSIDPASQVAIGTGNPNQRLTIDGAMDMLEQAAAGSSTAGYGQLWIKDATPTQLFFTDDDGTDMLLGGASYLKSFSFASRPGASGEFFQAGFYNYADADADLTQASLTVTHGGANTPHGAHVFIVSAGNGTTDGSDLVLTVTGTSITDAGVRDTGGTEVIEATAEVSATNAYFETALRWIGTITLTLSSTAGTAFDYTFNYGLAKYDDFSNRTFIITDFEVIGEANADDAGFNVQLIHHNATGWTYAPTGFVAGNTAILDMNVDYSTEQDLDGGEPFGYKRVGLSTSVDGGGSEGIIVRVTTSVNDAISYMDTHVGVLLQPGGP